MTEPLIIAIDGPSGAGKSTVARMLAQILNLAYLDTGAMYRAVGLKTRERGLALPIAEPDRVVQIAGECRIDLSTSASRTVVWLDGVDVSEAVREPEISLYASAVSAIPGVRRLLVARQREIGRDRGGVLEGRDIGSRVFPESPHKFFLTATETERARRRHAELASRGAPEPLEKVLAEMRRRDGDDSNRADSPLAFDESYQRIESDGLTPDDVVARMLASIGFPGRFGP
jgi:cytidylate kinase